MKAQMRKRTMLCPVFVGCTFFSQTICKDLCFNRPIIFRFGYNLCDEHFCINAATRWCTQSIIICQISVFNAIFTYFDRNTLVPITITFSFLILIPVAKVVVNGKIYNLIISDLYEHLV